MTKMTYKEQLLHPNWQRKRLERLEAADWQCENCGDESKTLHVHHKQYFKGRMVWEYDGLELVVLCEKCHTGEHQNLDFLRRLLVNTHTSQVIGLLGGFHKPCDWIEPGEIEEARQTDSLAFAAGFVAYLTHALDIDDMRKVAAFAASLANENSESRLWFTHSRGNTFGEDLD